MLFSTFQSSLIKLLIIRQASSTLFFLALILPPYFFISEVHVLFVLFVSVFGTAFIYRFLSLLEKVEVFNRVQRNLVSVSLQLFLWFLLYFKEQRYITYIYIGTFVIILILSDKIISLFTHFSFEKLHLSIIQRVLVQISRGQSAQVSVKLVFNELTRFEKIVFADLQRVFNANKSKTAPTLSQQQYFFDEIDEILNSKTQISVQLNELRQFLSLRTNLRHRSRQILLQTRAQAMVCTLIYIFFWFLSCRFLSMNVFSTASVASLALFCVGLIIILKLGTGFKWKT